MFDNAILLSYLDEESKRRSLECWFKCHRIDYDKNLSTEELRQLYIKIECGMRV